VDVVHPAAGAAVTRGRRVLGHVPAVRTNRAVLAALLAAYATGVGSETTGSDGGWLVAAAHGVAGLGTLLLVPWKRRVVTTGLRRRRATRWLALLMAALTLITIGLGVASVTGLVQSVAGQPVLWVHIAGALVLAPLVLWHVAARRRPRRTSRRTTGRPVVSRRAVLQAGALGATAVGSWVVTEAVVDGLGLPGARRRFTGSHELSSLRPAGMPATSWLDDRAPATDPADWRLDVVNAAGSRRFTVADLRDDDLLPRTTRREVLDCTSGWWSAQDWTGVPLSALVRAHGDARSVLVRSATGYAIRFPLDGMDGLLLATDVGGRPLSPGHGAPLRLVAPGRRGFWWVKWVVGVERQTTPSWWQPPFPLT